MEKEKRRMTMILLQRNFIRKCTELIYCGCDFLTKGFYTEAINCFEKYFNYMKTQNWNTSLIPKTLNIIAHESAAKSYAWRDSSEEDRKRAITLLQVLLREQTPSRHLKEIIRTLTLMRELYAGWGSIVSHEVKKKANLNSNFIFSFKEYNIQIEEYPEFGMRNIET
jgi:hypothetical protein